ncbi:6-phosphogluconolactonase [Stackebrandtia nassauensis]|uniref:6-phosphogluconolactonase n=1 Tax=Stackebrandtia nassauensis (strain DSM 44728 / CIP 108903 / NRRL B-16338 / NBRC 102104 / LLR-40K-21) TaxID=446470 RepID=D3Q4S0_STANL|nr:6-phosphogluconolactonase [Stackebrandtia nassauensis]ADD42100.1 6-phosphogluconolactonase [Stackebrandtia nassauensis DSM 44728]
MTAASVAVHPDAEVLAQSVAARLATTIIDAQAERGEASIVLTGGRIAARFHSALAASPVRHAIDWSRVDFWWGDERFLPAGDPDRNETQARESLLAKLPVDPARVHPMPASDGPDGDDPEAAAARYAAELAAASRPGHQQHPHFDVVMLGVGEDAHVASVFPEQPAVYENRPVVAVRGAPKPPPRRITLTFPTINSADEVWLIASGGGKADAVALAMSGAGPKQAPAAAVAGATNTRWLLDKDAAAALPSKFRSLLR